MKFSALFSTALVVLPAVSAGLVPRQNNGQNRGQGRAGGNNAGNNGGAAAGGANNGGAAAGGAAAGGQNNGDAQQSLTLDPKVICKGFAQNGQDPPVAGQVASAVSNNNFINNCLTVNLPLTDGQQIQGGSCNPAPIGVIPSIDKMPSIKISFPKNNAVIPADQAFTFTLNVANLKTGNFVNAQKNYFAAPQAVDPGSGLIIGHSHITCDKLSAIDQTTATNPKEFAFFKGINDGDKGGVLSAAVDKGLPAGAYRCCTINSSANHAPAIGPVAQHGSFDDCSYFTATPGGAGAGAGGNAGAGAGGANAGAGGAAAGAGGNAGAGAGGANAGAGGAAGGANGNAGAGAGGANAGAGAGGAAGGANGNAGAGAGGANATPPAGNAGAGANAGANGGGAKPPAATPPAAGAQPPATGAAGGAKPPAGANNAGGRPNFGRGGRPRRDLS